MLLAAGLGDGDHVLLLHQPAQRDLARALAMRFADALQGVVLEHLTPRQRAVRRERDVVLLAERPQGLLPQEGVILDLHAGDRRDASSLVEQARGEVGDADVVHDLLLHQRGHRAEGLLEVHVVVGPVEEQEVDVVEAEALDALVRGLLHLIGAGLLVPDLGGHEVGIPR